jgi:hypothetical protein
MRQRNQESPKYDKETPTRLPNNILTQQIRDSPGLEEDKGGGSLVLDNMKPIKQTTPKE